MDGLPAGRRERIFFAINSHSLFVVQQQQIVEYSTFRVQTGKCEAMHKSSVKKGQNKSPRATNAKIAKKGAFLVADNFIWTQAVNTRPSTMLFESKTMAMFNGKASRQNNFSAVKLMLKTVEFLLRIGMP